MYSVLLFYDKFDFFNILKIRDYRVGFLILFCYILKIKFVNFVYFFNVGLRD